MSRKFTSISRKLRGETGLGQLWSMFCSSSQLVFFSSYVTGLFGGIKFFIINPIQNRFPKVTWFLFFSFLYNK